MDSDWKVTACPYDCPCTCSMRARFRNGSVEIEANRDNPWTSFICAKGLRFRERVFDPRRITEPLLRDGAGWKVIPWDTAWKLWADNVSQAAENYGPLSLMYVTGAGSMYFSKPLIKNIFAELGGYTSTKGSLCSSIGSFGLKESSCGFGVPYITPELMSHSKGILLWGKNVYCTQPQMVRQIAGIRSKGGSLAYVDVRRSVTAKHSDLFTRITPGTDWALAAWLCSKITERRGCSQNWRERVLNADDFVSCISALDCEKLLSLSGVSNYDAEKLYEWLINNRPVTHIPAYGAQRYMHGDIQFKWIFALSVLCGGFDDPCAGLSFSKDEQALFPSELMTDCDNIRKFPMGNWGNCASEASPPIRALHITNANPVQQNPGSASIRKAMKDIPFKVCSEIFMTESAKECDLVLPVTTFLEEDHDWVGSYWHSYLVRSERVVAPAGNAKSDIEIYNGLARELGLKTDISELSRKLDTLMLSENRLSPVGRNIYKWDEPIYWCMSESKALLPSETAPYDAESEERLRLVSVHTNSYINGQSFDAPNVPSVPYISISPAFAAKRGISGGDLVQVSSEYGTVTMKARFDYDIAAAVAVTEQGPEKINELTKACTAPGGGAAYAECFIEVTKA